MISTQTLNPKVDAYLAKVQPFAQPIMDAPTSAGTQGLPGDRGNHQVEPAVF